MAKARALTPKSLRPRADGGPAPVIATVAPPTILHIGPADLTDALRKGLDDFWAMPSHLLFLCLIYPIAGLYLGRLAVGFDVLPMLFPLAAGFALIGPFAAIGLYEISRRREQGLDTSWRHAFDVLHSPSRAAIAELGGVLMVLFLVWLGVALILYRSMFGDEVPRDPIDFFREIFTSRAGWTLIVVGNAIGFVFAVATLVIGVISFPMLLDRNVDATTAIRTSLQAVKANPGTMALWGLIVAGLLVLGSIPALVGLAIVMPVLGHATWHLYRKVIAR
ncbi:MAG: DUF2189 domain-containing protein [Rhizobiales bacterium]|nr:DUF2189 domain-containing protein [Hyphomicrobiales bacterium]